MSDNTWLSTKDVAERFHTDYETVRRWLEAGKLKGYKIGRQWRVKESDLTSFLKPNV